MLAPVAWLAVTKHPPISPPDTKILFRRNTYREGFARPKAVSRRAHAHLHVGKTSQAPLPAGVYRVMLAHELGGLITARATTRSGNNAYEAGDRGQNIDECFNAY